MELLIVRHAQPEKVMASQGVADPALTDLGRRQAEALAGWVSREPGKVPDRIVSSPMRRAEETATIVAQYCGRGVEVDSRLAEFDVHAQQYVPLELAGADVIDEVASALTTGLFRGHRFDPEEFRLRVAAAFADLVHDTASRRVMVVCHGGVLNSYLSGVVGRPHGIFYLPRYTSVSRAFVGPDGTARLGSLNELPHAEVISD